MTRRLFVRFRTVGRPLAWVVFAALCCPAFAEGTKLSDIPARAAALLEQLAVDADGNAASDAAARLLLESALFLDPNHPDSHAAFSEAGHARWIAQAVARVEVDDPRALTQRLLARPAAARELSYLLIDPSHDDLKRVFDLFIKLDEAFGPQLDEFPGLTAALCVVHDREIERRINENTVHATDPVALFRFYTANADQMLFGVRDVPGSLLVWVVDSTASIEEMAWALEEYQGDRAIGRRFFDIKYDYDHFLKGNAKKVTKAGFSLPNIRRYGGVCADQAYFAVAVGKAIGVPTTYTVGRGADVGHAWVGYFEQRGRNGGWNFNEGRYAAYQGVRGVVEHPQYGFAVDDSFVSVLAEAITLSPQKRYAAAGMVEAAALMEAVPDSDEAIASFARPSAGGDDETERRPVRGVSTADRLDLIKQGLMIDPGFAPGWMVVSNLAEQGRLDEAQKKQWAESVTRLCGDRYPDFAVTVLRPILASIDDPEQQSDLWDAAHRVFRARKDIAAEVRMLQGELWEQQGDLRKAAGFYEEVLRRYANDGPFVVQALARFEALLIEAGRPERITVLYREAFNVLDKPDRMAQQFAQQSNYYRVGSRLVQQLRSAGDARGADRVEKEIVGATGLRPAM